MRFGFRPEIRGSKRCSGEPSQEEDEVDDAPTNSLAGAKAGMQLLCLVVVVALVVAVVVAVVSVVVILQFACDFSCTSSGCDEDTTVAGMNEGTLYERQGWDLNENKHELVMSLSRARTSPKTHATVVVSVGGARA